MSEPSANSMQCEFPGVDAITERVDRLLAVDRPRYRRLWSYWQNPMRVTGASDGGQDRPYRQAQEWGLPARITGWRSGSDLTHCGNIEPAMRKQVVIENDIGWRVDTMVDYLFGKPLVIDSSAANPERRALIGELLRQILAFNGGAMLLQQLALLGGVYGFVDVLVKLDESAIESGIAGDIAASGLAELGQPPAGQPLPDGAAPSDGGAVEDDGAASRLAGPATVSEEAASELDPSTTRAASNLASRTALLSRLARMVRLEVIEPARALPFLCSADYRRVEAYGQCFDLSPDVMADREEPSGGRSTWVDLLRRLTSRKGLVRTSRNPALSLEIITPTQWRRYMDGQVVARGENSLGRIPLVHIQNTAVPFAYSGASDVEPLIPMQDELNTRLSDRANRITLQSFKMYLGKGIENFDSLPVAPGRMWMTDNAAADVIEFGGDASCPSEESHISDVREALDKISGVTPIAAGAVEGRIGHLTSAVALRITLQALLAKTEKKRATYGAAIQQICEIALSWLDRAGLFRTSVDERRVELNWSSPIPENESDRLAEAQAKLKIGVAKEVVLRELGY